MTRKLFSVTILNTVCNGIQIFFLPDKKDLKISTGLIEAFDKSNSFIQNI